MKHYILKEGICKGLISPAASLSTPLINKRGTLRLQFYFIFLHYADLMDNKYVHNNSVLKDRRKELRKNATPQEKFLWFHLKSKKLGVKFLRQHSIGPYIADFYCPQNKLIIEIDGSQHTENQEYDYERNRYLEAQGYIILRFWNNEVSSNVLNVLVKVKESLTTKL